MIEKIVSGGQTGVDRAALDAAIESNIAYEGWCPKGRIDELGIIPEEYCALKEISGEFKNEKENYNTRTKHNIRDSDGTLILVPKIPIPLTIKDGTLLTIQEAQDKKKPYLVIDLSEPQQKNVKFIIIWAKEHNLKILNIAGPRELSCPGIYQLSLEFLENTLPHLTNACSYKAKF
jgi:hypothetical protein